MARIVLRRASDPAALARALQPRDDLVHEAPAGDGRFVLAAGPFADYERTVRVDGGTIVETIRYRLGIPYFGFLFVLPVRWRLRRSGGTAGGQPWWAPPDRLDHRGAVVLGVLAVVSLLVGYVNTLFTQTVNFAAQEFGTSETGQGVALAVVRSGVFIALAFATLADRRGRRLAILAACWAAPLVASLGSLAPNLATLTLSQAIGRPLGLALLLLVGVVAAEEMPAGARAYAVSLLAMATGLGAGLCVLALPLADLGERGWRLVYVVPLAFLALIPGVARRLPESRRFATAPRRPTRLREHGRRFWLLAMSGLLGNLLVAPASGFQNRFLDDERGFSASRITLFTLVTSTPAALGIVAGGRLADVRGRRVIGAVGLVAGSAATVGAFFAAGWPLWTLGVAAAVGNGLAVPALGVYGAELFPTGSRGRAGGWLTVLSLTGSSIGLVAAGWLISELDSFGRAMAILAVGPAVVVVLVLAFYPETAGRELEDLNPEDRPGAGERADPGGGPGPGDHPRPSQNRFTV